MKFIQEKPLPPPVWVLDGARFGVEIPSYDIWHQMKKSSPDLADIPHKEMVLRAPHNFRQECLFLVKACAQRSANGHILDMGSDIMASVKTGSQGEILVDRHSFAEKDFQCTASLTPLDSNGVRDYTFGNDNPDGSFMRGGTIYVDGKPCHPNVVVPSGSEVYVGDTVSGYELMWYVYQGRMYYLGTLFTLDDISDVIQIFHGIRRQAAW